jgi:hypothetical protein
MKVIAGRIVMIRDETIRLVGRTGGWTLQT